ncbi:enoyl-CoA hydratase-related protein [Chloroflexota bacterium]
MSKVTINRPNRLNVFRDRICYDMVKVFGDAAEDTSMSVVGLTGVGKRAFSVGCGDLNWEAKGISAKGTLGIPVKIEHFWALADIPKPTIAVVRGYAFCGGHVLHLVCDIKITSEKARFGQNGPHVGSYPIIAGESGLWPTSWS